MGQLVSKLCLRKKERGYLIIFLFVGILLMLFPMNINGKVSYSESFTRDFNLEKEETRLKEVISMIQGVGACEVILSIYGNLGESITESEPESTLFFYTDTEAQHHKDMSAYPAFQGAVVVVEGYPNAKVRYNVLSAVMSYTGLDVNKITICPMKE